MKKYLMIALLICLMLTLTACKCKHEETSIVNAKDPACTEEGYTGDVVCNKCNETVTPGEAIPATGHTESQIIPTLKAATCTEDGYTGDKICEICEAVLETGEVVPAFGHTEELLNENAKKAGCTEDGYTGDQICRQCREIAIPGEVIPATGHTEGELMYVSEPTCVTEGYTGDAFCTVCNVQVTTGEVIPATGVHTAELFDYCEPTCNYTGYTGNEICNVCGELLKQGEEIPALPHNYPASENYVEATCMNEGYSGDNRCPDCWYYEEGHVIEKLPHDYVDGFCSVCGWKESGLYVDGEMAFTWQQLVDNNYVQLCEEYGHIVLESVVPTLYGELWVGEDIQRLGGRAFKESELSAVYLPYSLTKIDGSEVFLRAAKLETVKFFSGDDYLPGSFFEDCASLKNVILPDSIEEISSEAFMNCTALETITLPASLEKLYRSAFEGCTSLKEVVFNENLRTIEDEVFSGCASLTEVNLPASTANLGEKVFNGSGVTHLTLPAEVISFYSQEDNTTLVSIDMSACCVDSLYSDAFQDCTALETVILPANMTTVKTGAFRGCTNLRTLTLPTGAFAIEGKPESLAELTSLTEIVWPATLTDGSALAGLPNLQKINYCGKEIQWSMTVSRDMFPNAEIVFDSIPEA